MLIRNAESWKQWKLRNDAHLATSYGSAQLSSALGPDATQVMVQPTPEELVTRVASDTLVSDTDQRRWLAAQRFQILSENIKQQVADRLADLQSDSEVLARIAAWIDNTVNVGLDVTNQLCVVWKHNAERVIDEDDDGTDSFATLVRETKFHTHSEIWNRQAFFLGPIIVVPVEVAGTIQLQTLLPHTTEIIPDPKDPLGEPLAAAWRVAHDRVIFLDDKAWTYYKVERDHVQVLRRVPHALGEFPGCTLRMEPPDATYGWWGSPYRHQRLVDATIKLADLDARLSFVRKCQSFRLLSMIGDLEGIPDGQRLGPEGPIAADTAAQSAPEQTHIASLDYDTPPQHFLDHMQAVEHRIARAYGGELREDGSVEFNYDKLTEIRGSQIEFALDFEIRLWRKVLLMARKLSTEALPTPEDLDKLTIRYPPLARSYSDPQQRRDQDDWDLKRGLTDFEVLLMRAHPLMTREQATAYLTDRIEAQLPLVELFTKRDLSTDPTQENVEHKTPAEAFGAQGPKARDNGNGSNPKPKPNA